MRLITHNMLKCNIKGVAKGYPLLIEPTKVETHEGDFLPEFIQNIFPKLDWEALRQAAKSLDLKELPPLEEVTEAMRADESFLHDVHHVLLEVQVMEGNLVCPETGRRFPIKDGIPNMLLHEDEI